MGVGDVSKRILVGRKLRSTQAEETLLPKKIALPVFASDALSSVAYAPDEVFIMLGIAGFAAYEWSWKVGIAVALVMLTVVASYRQTVQAYPSGGGDYEVAKVNLGRHAGITVASALLVDYVLTVAVSVSAGVDNAAAALSFVSGHETTYAVLVVLGLAALNLRGVRESGRAFAAPTYLFITALALTNSREATTPRHRVLPAGLVAILARGAAAGEALARDGAVGRGDGLFGLVGIGLGRCVVHRKTPTKLRLRLLFKCSK